MFEYKLTEEILKRSQSNVWDMAKLEWKLNVIYEAEEPETCLCGHFPIGKYTIMFDRWNFLFTLMT